jgi:hypothetical protein
MKTNILKIVVLSVVAAAIALGPTPGFAQEKKDEAATEKKDAPKEGKKGKNGGLPARGKLAAVDKAAKTIKVGERTFHVTDQTRIQKTGKPATLDDAVVGENVGIFYKEEGGKLMALTLRFGPQPEGEAKGEKKGGEKKEKKKQE